MAHLPAPADRSAGTPGKYDPPSPTTATPRSTFDPAVIEGTEMTQKLVPELEAAVEANCT
jgi:hypothetical protein